MDLLQCMEPILKEEIKEGSNWIHQIKWDGIRGISYIEDKKLRLFTKRGKERTSFYPEVQNVIELFDGNQGVLDGELVVFNQDQPNFSDVLVRERVRSLSSIPKYIKAYPVHYIVFDLLYYNGKDLRNIPLVERLELLKNHVLKSQKITITDSFEDGKALLNLMKEKDFEGVVSKKLDSHYIAGKKHSDWYKVKIMKKMLVVIGGIQMKNNYPTSLLIGIYKNKKLYYVGKVSSGLTAKDLQLLKQNIHHLETKQSPFQQQMKTSNILWLEPILTCWVQFLEWTNDGSLRHPTLIGFSNYGPSDANGEEIVNDNKSK